MWVRTSLLFFVLAAAASTAAADSKDWIKSRLNLLDYSLQPVLVPPDLPEEFTVVLRLDAGERTLVLRKHSLRAVDYRAWAVSPDGRVAIEPPPVATYRGFVAEAPNTVVAASLRPAGLEALILQNNAPAWYVQPLAGVEPDAAPELHAIFRGSDLDASDATCGTFVPPDHGDHLEGAALELDDPAFLDVNCQRRFRVALDADVEFFQLNGSSVPNTIADMEAVLNGVEAIYARDLRLVLEVGDTFVRTSEPDPYTAFGGADLLNELKDHWNAEHSGLPRAVVQLFTGRNITGSTIGIAFLSTACNRQNAYSAVQSRWSTNFAQRVSVSAHEFGHIWSSGHCNGQPDCSIMCSAVGSCGAGFSNFGQTDSRQILFYSEFASCLTPAPPYPTPLPPRAIYDGATVTTPGPIVIDVLQNDIDGNCDPLTLTTFDPVAPSGATITRVVGGGPGGRDVLRYTPVAGFIGMESFGYAIADGAGRTDSSYVNVLNNPRRPPDFPPGTLPGLEAFYYVVPASIASLPDFSTLTPYASEIVPQVNFPSSSGAFAGSGRSDHVAAVFRGYFRATTSAIYTFYLESDEGSRLYIGETLVVDNDGLHGWRERSGLIGLDVGRHPLRIEYFERTGFAGLVASYSAGPIPRAVIPPLVLKHDGVLGDLNCDGVVNFFDIDPFVAAISSRLAYEAIFSNCDWWNADVNHDAAVNFQDIDAFVQALITGGAPVR